MSDKKILTYIDVLDKLLGIERGKAGIKPGGIILIRGEPGSGKTTLGLQILSQYLKNLRDKEDKTKVVYFSLERDSVDVLQFVRARYKFFENEKLEKNEPDFVKILPLDSRVMESVIYLNREHPRISVNRIADDICSLLEIQDEKHALIGAGVRLGAYAAKVIADYLKMRRSSKVIGEARKENKDYKIVFIDSLNVLLHLFQKVEKYKNIPERLFLNTICDSFREIFNNSVIIFTSEYHFKNVTKSSAVSESFFCDIEISLFSEPIAVPGNYESEFESPLGNNTLSLINPEKVKSLQTQSFCRVLKSRQAPNQARRCAYDIVSGKGIEFYETYPGDGHLTMFEENKRQEQNWRTLFAQDVPILYPSLRCDHFDRSSLQRISAAQRRFRYVPQRTDMYLTSFDNYWINWYSELCMKSNIADVLRRELNIEGPWDNELLPLLNIIHADITKTDHQVEFIRKIRQNLHKFFKEMVDVTIGLSKGIKTLITSKDMVEYFMSKLLNELAKTDKPRAEKNAVFDINRPCMRCLWNRSLLDWLYKNLEQNNKDKLFNTCKLYLDSNNPNQQNNQVITFGKKLTILAGNAMASCLEGQREECREELKKKGFSDTFTFEEFLHSRWKPDLCEWKRSIIDKLPSIITKTLKDEASLNEGDIIEVANNKEELIKRYADEFLKKLEQLVFESIFSEEVQIEGYEKVKGYLEKLEVNDATYKEMWVIILARLFFDVMQRPARYQLLAPMPVDKLRLFGEKKSEIIPELEDHKPVSKRPVHRSGYLFSLRDQNTYCSVPYDANIGFIVFRRDILDGFYKSLKKKENDQYLKIIQSLIEEQYSLLKAPYDESKKKYKALKEKYKELDKGYGISEINQSKPADLPKLVKGLVEESIRNRYPTTWEEIIAYHLLMKKNKEEPELHFLIETRTPDSYLCTMMEFLWSCGANLRIRPDYLIDRYLNTISGLMRAFYLMGLMFQEGIIPEDSTLEVREFAHKYNRPNGNDKKRPDWVFARHWYSTLTDILSEPGPNAKGLPTADDQFLWQHKHAKLGIMPIPVSFSNYFNYKNKGGAWHISCWGDWHLAMLSGTENIELGVELVNMLMSSDRICERASANSSVPTVSAFYELYGDSRCFNQPARKDIELPDWTYNNLREHLFKHAKSRSQTFDYHHCIRELHSVMEYIRLCTKKTSAQKPEYKLNKKIIKELCIKLDRALDNIMNFRTGAYLIY